MGWEGARIGKKKTLGFKTGDNVYTSKQSGCIAQG